MMSDKQAEVPPEGWMVLWTGPGRYRPGPCGLWERVSDDDVDATLISAEPDGAQDGARINAALERMRQIIAAGGQPFLHVTFGDGEEMLVMIKEET